MIALCALVASAAALQPRFPVRVRAQRHAPLSMAGGAAGLLRDASAPTPPDEVVKAVEKACKAAPGRLLTAADLSAEAGVDITTARSGLTELASALAGVEGTSVAASKQGNLLYSFPRDVRGELASLSAASAAREKWNAAKPALAAAGRAAFGLALFASIAVIFAAIAVLQAEAGGEGRRSDERRGGGWGGGGGMGGGMFQPGYGYGYSPLDFWWPRPYGWFEPPPKMSLPGAPRRTARGCLSVSPAHAPALARV